MTLKIWILPFLPHPFNFLFSKIPLNLICFCRSHLKNPILNYFQNRAGKQSLGADARPQYSCADQDGTKCGGMLNTDWEVLYNMPLNEDNFLSECDVSAATTDCEKADTYNLSVKYSEVNHFGFFLLLMTSTISI